MIDVPLVVIGGNVSVSGEILSPTRFKLTGSTSAFLDFKVASTTAKVHFGFSQSEIDIGAAAEFCLEPLGCNSFGMIFNPNWGTVKVKICVDFPDPVGENACKTSEKEKRLDWFQAFFYFKCKYLPLYG